MHSVNAVNYDKLIIFNEILSPPFLCDKNLCQSMFLHSNGFVGNFGKCMDKSCSNSRKG